MINANELYGQGFKRGLMPDPEMMVSDWADKNRHLSQKASAEPGRWRTERTPYLREIMDCLSPVSPHQRVVFMKGAQIGGTEAGQNWIGYTVHLAPGPMMIVQPTVETAKRWSKQRLAPMIDDTPAISRLIKAPRERDSGNTVLTKEYQGGVMIITGANSAVGLRSVPVMYLFCDEIDGYPSDVEGEGDPVSLAEVRTGTFSRKKIFLVSTPTIKGFSRIEREYEDSDKRKYHVPCPFCDHYQQIIWDRIKWPKAMDGTPQLDDIAYQCSRCEKLIPDHHKTDMLARGQWVAEAPGPGKSAGFHLSSLYSPLGWVSWAKIAAEFIEAKKDTELLKTWINTRLGETWEEEGEQPDDNYLFSRREDYGPEIPAGGVVLTCGADVHPDRIEAEVVAWGIGQESWSITYEVFRGSTSEQEVWKELDDFLMQEWRHVSGVPIRIACACIDSGDQTQEVYMFVKPRQMRRVFAVKGSSIAGHPLVGRPSKNNIGGVQLFSIGTDTAKDVIYGRLKIADPGAGFMHFPTGYDQEYFLQLTAEKIVTKMVKGFPVRAYKLTRERNEALDVRVYALAALVILNADMDKVAENLQKKAEEIAKNKTEKPKARTPVKRTGFVHRWKS